LVFVVVASVVAGVVSDVLVKRGAVGKGAGFKTVAWKPAPPGNSFEAGPLANRTTLDQYITYHTRDNTRNNNEYQPQANQLIILHLPNQTQRCLRPLALG
jgi:hypothetical protein